MVHCVLGPPAELQTAVYIVYSLTVYSVISQAMSMYFCAYFVVYLSRFLKSTKWS